MQVVAKALSGAVRASDIVARVGGDEFAILLWHVNASNALAKARAIERVIEITEIPRAGGGVHRSLGGNGDDRAI